MFNDNDNDTDARYSFSTVDAVRDAALIIYGRFVARLNNMTADDDSAKTKHQYLSLQETENIVREHGYVFEGTYAIGGDSQEEAKKQIQELLAALTDRIMSNVLQEGVRQNLLECDYDVEKDDFTFSVTEKGKKTVEECRKNSTNPQD